MSVLALLLRPRLLGLWNRWRRATPGQRWAYALFALLALAFWGLVFWMMGWLVGRFYAVEVFGPILTRKLLELLMVALFMLLAFSNLVTALSTFYLSDDLDLLLSLPVSRASFHFARLTETVVQSSWMLVFFGLPIFVAYGVAYGAGWPYYLALVCAAPGLVLIPAGLGVALASVLVSVFPARRLREALVLAGLGAVIFVFVALRLIRPERIMDAESFDNVAAYIAALQSPIPLLAPPRWLSEVLVAALTDRPAPWLLWGLLLTGAVAATGVARWVTGAVYDQGRARAQEAREARLARAGWLDRVLGVLTLPLPRQARALVVKDVKVFIRDPAQWSQVFLVGSIVVIALASVWALPMDMVRGPWASTWRNLFAFMSHVVVGFIMAAVAARFQFTAVSAEGRAFWVVRTSPIRARRFLWAKLAPTILPMIVVGQVLAIATTVILGASAWLVAISSFTALAEAFALGGLAIGLGAVYPSFKADNAARMAASPAGVLFMVVALLLVLSVITIEALPAWLLLRAAERPLLAWEWGGVLGGLGLVGLICGAAAVIPVRFAATRLWARELPGS